MENNNINKEKTRDDITGKRAFSIFSSIIVLVIVIFYYGISISEEKLLIKRFGKEYKQYRHNVPMLLPYKKIRKGRKNEEYN